MKTEHTPTPWHYAPGELIYGPKGESVASCRFVTNFKEENIENMRCIVRAVNAYDANQKTIAALFLAVKIAREYLDSQNHPRNLQEQTAFRAHQIEVVDKAIADNKGAL